MASVLQTITFESKQRFNKKSLTGVTINNYSTTAVSFINQGVTRDLPPAQTVVGVLVPMPFEINNSGNAFDLDLTIDFSAGTGRVVIDYFEENS